eukprot:2921052-Prymnesium_polylepis.1
MKRPRMNDALPWAVISTIMPGTAMSRSRMKVLRAPQRSHIGPVSTRMTIVPLTARLPASERVSLSRSRPPSFLGFFR